MLLFVTGVLVAGSGFMALRPEVFGLRMHPYILPLALAFPFVFLARFDVFPSKVLAALLVFVAIYIFSVFNGASVSVGEIFKVVSALVTIVTCALLVRRRGDFVIGALGLSIAVAMLAIHGLREDVAGGGVDMMEGANKNSYSLFALPAFLLAGYIVINLQSTPMYVKGMFAVCTLPALVVTFMGGNRSGYLGAVLIAVMLFWNRRGKGLIFVAVLGSAVAFWILQFGTTKVLNERLRKRWPATSRTSRGLGCS